jgi:dynein heavy chain
MPAMERLLEELAGKEINPNFRLWLTSMPSKTFPVPVLQVGLKITNEPPKGLKANLSRSYGDLSEQLFESCAKPAPWKKLLFGLCSFHAIIQERRKFGSLGWNIPYEWNNSDLTISIKLLKMYLEEQEEVPYDTLRYITGEVNYGGRVTDHWDQRTMNSIISRLICSEMLDDTYRFDNQGKYYAPPQGELSDYRDYINSLPLRDSPDVFGLHSNADITFNRQETRTVIETIITMSGGGAGDAGGADVEANVAVVAQDIQDRLPAILDIENSHPTTFALVEGGAMNSLGTDLAQEILKYNRLLRVMLSSLKDLQRAIKGLVVMSSQLEEVFFSVYFNQVPKMWAAKAYPSLKPLGSWVYDLIARVEFIRGWTVSGPPTSFWLSGLFFP